MSFFSKIYEYLCAPAGTYSSDLFEATNDDSFSIDNVAVINPASGLPMTGGVGGIDVAGNPYGVDASLIHHDLFESDSSCMFDDDWSSPMFDNDCSSAMFDTGSDMDSCFGIYNNDSMFD